MSKMRAKLIENLSLWFQKNARTLPWRSQPHPYSVWLSEIMLQQTQVTTVLPYFDRFIKKFPAVTDLASAPLDDVYKLWAGLGYYSRARNLHKGAQAMAAKISRGEGFPNSREEWLEIPGVGEYTAGAVSSIAFNLREPIVDGNVERVLSRVNAWTKRDPKKVAVWAEARALVEMKEANPRILNQAMMELGALVCRPKSPKCAECPIAKQCKGKSAPELYPEPKAKTNWKKISEARFLLLRGYGPGLEIYLERNQEGAWRESLWDFPAELAGKIETKATLKGEFHMKHVVTHHKINRSHHVFAITKNSRGKGNSKEGPGEWFRLNALPAVPSPVTKAMSHLKKLGFT
jgi:A/G-specific adenine glycosylase